MNYKHILFGAGAVLVGLLVISTLFMGGGDKTPSETVDDVVRGEVGDPVDVTLDFYQEWLKAVRATSTDPFELDLQNSTVLSIDLSQRLQVSHSAEESPEIDFVLCQPTPPAGLRARLIVDTETDTQVLVMSSKPGLPGQAVVKLNKQADRWTLSDITCTQGENAPDREFSFDQDGLLLKSVPEPLDARYWHLVFEQAGEFGFTAPLFFSSDSVCIFSDGAEAVCNENSLRETDRVQVQGQMTEAGVEVMMMRGL